MRLLSKQESLELHKDEIKEKLKNARPNVELPLFVPIDIEINNLTMFDGDRNPATKGDQVNISGAFAMYPRVDLDWTIRNAKTEYFNAVFKFNFKTALDAQIGNFVQGIPIPKLELYSQTFNPITFTIGFLPVSITPKFSISAYLDAGMRVKIVGGFSYELEYQSGVRYQRGKWSDIKLNKETKKTTGPFINAPDGGTLEYGLVAKLGLYLYGTIGPYLTGKLYDREFFTTARTAKNWHETYLGVKFGAGLDIDVLGIFSIPLWSKDNIIIFEWLVHESGKFKHDSPNVVPFSGALPVPESLLPAVYEDFVLYVGNDKRSVYEYNVRTKISTLVYTAPSGIVLSAKYNQQKYLTYSAVRKIREFFVMEQPFFYNGFSSPNYNRMQLSQVKYITGKFTTDRTTRYPVSFIGDIRHHCRNFCVYQNDIYIFNSQIDRMLKIDNFSVGAETHFNVSVNENYFFKPDGVSARLSAFDIIEPAINGHFPVYISATNLFSGNGGFLMGGTCNGGFNSFFKKFTATPTLFNFENVQSAYTQYRNVIRDNVTYFSEGDFRNPDLSPFIDETTTGDYNVPAGESVVYEIERETRGTATPQLAVTNRGGFFYPEETILPIRGTNPKWVTGESFVYNTGISQTNLDFGPLYLYDFAATNREISKGKIIPLGISGKVLDAGNFRVQ